MLPRLRTVAVLLLVAGAMASGRLESQDHHEKPADTASAARPASVGEVNFANSGRREAQASFLEGLAQLHNFEYESAGELFRRAQAIDPGFAMAYWGEAMTYNHPIWMQQDRSAARKVLARLGATPAARAAKASTAREKAYLDAVETLYGESEKYARDFAYSLAMADIHRAFPDDPDAAAFYALSLLGTAHSGRDFAIYMKAAAILEPVFQAHPRHPGAAHYLIHSYDDPVHAPLGLRAARRYSQIAPSAAHAQHMCSHIFVAMGMWADVVQANEAATRVVNARHTSQGHPPGVCGHYPFWLEYGYLQQGRFADAKRVLSACYSSVTAQKTRPSTGALDPDDSQVGSFAAMRSRYLIDTEDWEGEVLGWVVPGGGPAAEVTFAFATGFAQTRSGHAEAARASLEELRKARRALESQLASAQASDQFYGVRAKILEDQLAALIKIGESDRAAVLKDLTAAASAEEKMAFEFGPPAVDKPSYELLGETLLASGRPADARDAFEKALARTPQRTSTMLGLMRAAAAAGDTKRAAQIKVELKSIWSRADGLPKDVQ